ncbi:hypothetical protein FZEAL_6942 [Fusarium zealandicum]|uniref:Transcription factor domain-containing protein n=1 Tax=Fusarium zealandicum TaxID=1053134 RepID=A0A8H4UHH8_9HYPO|nr:hypothetical protein FZEAL_6942 [Fusarium zealandicum]
MASGGRRPLWGCRQQEESWYYYLTEITLRRIANGVLNALYQEKEYAWTDSSIPTMVKTANQVEQQLSEWYRGLPVPIQFDEHEPPTGELPFMIRARVLEIRLWVYRPFLYYAIHNPPDGPFQSLLRPFVEKALMYTFRILNDCPTRHRHHGVWFSIRTGISAALSILAAGRCGNLPLPVGWTGIVRATITKLEYWEAEAPGLSQALEVLNAYLLVSTGSPSV